MSSNIIKADNGVTSGVTGIVQTAGSDGTLQLQTTTSGGTATTALTIDNSQNVGVGVTPSAWQSYKAIQTSSGAILSYSTNDFRFTSNALRTGGNWQYINTAPAVMYLQDSSGGTHQWYNAVSGTAGNTISFTQAMTLDNSNQLLVGCTSEISGTGTAGVQIGVVGTQGRISIATSSTGSQDLMYFSNPNGLKGSINLNGSITTFNSLSDYRLKNNPTLIQNAISIIDRLNPVTFTWSVDGNSDAGFLAHEFQSVLPNFVTGSKDAVDSEGKPIYQMMDNSGVIPYLTKAIQELSAQVTALQTTVTAQAATITALQTKVGA